MMGLHFYTSQALSWGTEIMSYILLIEINCFKVCRSRSQPCRICHGIWEVGEHREREHDWLILLRLRGGLRRAR